MGQNSYGALGTVAGNFFYVISHGAIQRNLGRAHMIPAPEIGQIYTGSGPQGVDAGQHIEVRQVQEHKKYPVLEPIFPRVKTPVPNGSLVDMVEGWFGRRVVHLSFSPVRPSSGRHAGQRLGHHQLHAA